MTIEHRLARSSGLQFETRPRLKIGDRVVLKTGRDVEVTGVGVIDFAPNGPAYEVVEVTDLKPVGSMRMPNSLHYAVDLYDAEDDDGS